MRQQNTTKSARTLALIGCSLDEFVAHLKSLFTNGMSWELFMEGKIHLDHKTPIRAFNLLNPEEQMACFHYTNYQPLWAVDNLRKSDLLPNGTRARDIIHDNPSTTPN